MPQSDDFNRCLRSAIHMLSRREHSRQELAHKLSAKPCAENIDLASLLDQLQQADYLNDQRFAESFVNARINKGQGPQKIRYELNQRGVSTTLIEQTLDACEVDWLELAKAQREKRFGVKCPADYKEQAKQSRFLAGRGFFSDTIYAIFKSV